MIFWMPDTMLILLGSIQKHLDIDLSLISILKTALTKGKKCPWGTKKLKEQIALVKEEKEKFKFLHMPLSSDTKANPHHR
jgi:hypothetical protein